MKTTKIVAERVNKADELQKAKIVERLMMPNVPYKDSLVYMENEIAQSKRMSSFKYDILCFRNDGIYQLHCAIEEIFGVSQAKTDSQPSGGESEIQTIDIQLADGTRLKVPYGKINLDGLGEDAFIDINYNSDKNILLIKGKCQFRFASLIDDIVSRTKELLATRSIYSCQALEIADINSPKIMDLSNIDKELMVISDSTEYELQPLKSRILRPDTCLEKGIPLKYGCLLEGPYGTGRNIIVNLFVA